jgi:NAD(P)-dependent dehydrogenase (short-subunit alcohol dehydrogenase family)
MCLDALQITVNAIAAGAFESKMMKATLDRFGEVIRSRIPLKRVGTPEVQCFVRIIRNHQTFECSPQAFYLILTWRCPFLQDITGVCIWLSSRAGSWTTGAIIAEDGGALVTSAM